MAQEKFQAVLTGVPGEPYQITSCSVSFSRDTSADGRPSSMVYGGQIALTAATTAESKLVEAMINAQNKPFGDGTIKITTAQTEGVFRTISFKKGYITSYSEAFDMQGGSEFSCSFNISAEEITVGAATLINKWPTTS
ncbi:type VI secretion system tube protein TssD [Hymenobacter sp. GOD-10R]|uniref:type VI secretion system tube protein TssD n=1 Tax=Hymenobacter sp. GOD-10R TaxID=3093922 RepID=UPI002D774360|nr:type VI secretion system tube protein TssD [Hymenobacter sp. GOD-10R]WRQ31280.1 type VI secretion system tube protein TssD [Hymenobacter sp. GOD-10R]